MIRVIITPRGRVNVIEEFVRLVAMGSIRSYVVADEDNTIEGKPGRQFEGGQVKWQYHKEPNLVIATIDNDQDLLLGSFVSRLYARLGDKIRSIHIDVVNPPSWLKKKDE